MKFVRLLHSPEGRAVREFGVTLAAAIDEWPSARKAVGEAFLSNLRFNLIRLRLEARSHASKYFISFSPDSNDSGLPW